MYWHVNKAAQAKPDVKSDGKYGQLYLIPKNSQRMILENIEKRLSNGVVILKGWLYKEVWDY